MATTAPKTPARKAANKAAAKSGKPSRSYVFCITTTFNDLPFRQFDSLAEAREYEREFGMNQEIYAELEEIAGGGIGDVIGTSIFFLRNGALVRRWSRDLDW